MTELSFANGRVDNGEAASALLALFGKQGEITRLGGERDRNFRVKDAQGRTYLLKISHPGEPPGVTDLQTRALAHLAACGLPVPCPLPGRDGEAVQRWAARSGLSCATRLLTFLEGAQLASIQPGLPV